MNKKVLALIALIIIGGIIYFYHAQPTATSVTTTPTTTAKTAVKVSSTPAVQKAAPDQGAGGVYDPNTPEGSADQCAACNQYSGAQKGQCLAALNC